MATKKVKIKMNQQSTRVVAECSIEYVGEEVPSNDEVLNELSLLQEKALLKANDLTLRYVSR